MNTSMSRKMSAKSTPDYSESERSTNEDDIDYTQNSELYYSTLSKLQKHAVKVRLHDIDREKTLMEYLPVNEKFNLNKEGKVLTRWQERQRDWEKIQTNISKRLGNKSSRPLMMTTTDEYRAKIEEYDLIQAALPLKDRYSDSSWQMTLRGGGPICIAIGHIFSGIECKFDVEVPKPKMIRKPKPMECTFKNDTFLEKTDAYMKKRKKYEKTITEIRPHNLTYKDANNLVVRSSNLFLWAKESSTQFYAAQQEEMALSVIEEEHSVASVGSLARDPHINSDIGLLDANSTLGPKIEFLSSKEVLFDTIVGNNCNRTVSFKNIGSVAVSYRWKKISAEKGDGKKKRSNSVKDQAELLTSQQNLGGILAGRGVDGGALRSYVLSKERECFFCLKDCGEVLPDETIATNFVFSSRAGSGVFTSQWLLEFTPLDCSVFLTPPAVTDRQREADQVKVVGSVTVSLHSHCVELDERMTARKSIAEYIGARTVESMVGDIVQDCVRRVRAPVRTPDLQDRQAKLFRRINEGLLSKLSGNLGFLLPLFVTPERLDTFAAISKQVSELHGRITLLLQSLQCEDTGESVNEAGVVGPLDLSETAAQAIRDELFPEKLIEIFDEVSEEALTPSWNYNVSSVRQVLETLQSTVEEVRTLEDRIQQRNILLEKERVKAEKRAARKAAAQDSDDDEEEEEEEEDDEDSPKVRAKHPLQIKVEDLVHGLDSAVNLLVVRPLDSQLIFATARAHVADFTERFDEWRAQALTDAGLLELSATVPIPQLPSPFASQEGSNAWAHALKQTSAVAEPVVPVKGAPKAPKNAPIPTGPTAQQVDFFYRQMYEAVRSGVLDMTERLFGDVDGVLIAAEVEDSAAYELSGGRLCDIAALRGEDVALNETDSTGTVAFVSFAGDAFAANSRIQSAFDVVQRNKWDSVQPVCRLLENNAKIIVLLHEPQVDTGCDILAQYAEIQTLVLRRREEYIVATNKQLKKQKKPPGVHKAVKFLSCQSFAELNCLVDNLLRFGEPRLVSSSRLAQRGTDKRGAFFAQNIPVVLLQTVTRPGVVPREPEYVKEESDDDEAPISVGAEENLVKKLADWYAKRPHRVAVDVDVLLDESKKTPNATTKQTVQVYSDAAAAVKEVFALTSNLGDRGVWVEACEHVASAGKDQSAFNRLAPAVTDKFVSEQLRECAIWCGVMQKLPTFSVDDESSLGGNNSLLTQHLRRLFPYSVAHGSKPVGVAVLGGDVRSDKFRVADQLIDWMDTIVFVGVMALPFMGLSAGVHFAQHDALCASYRSQSIALVQKARMRGCRLVWPSDIVTGDEVVSDDDKQKCFERFEKDSRNEGAEYNGETKTISLSGTAPQSPTEDFLLGSGSESLTTAPILSVEGFVYDIGPESCRALKSVLASADVALVWGTAGACEISSFQAGQQALVDGGCVKVPEDGALSVELAKNPLHTLVVGDSCVEWFCRLADSDGEMGGDLVAAGLVAFSNRSSRLVSALMGQFLLEPLKTDFLLRPSSEDEWVYSKRVVVEEEDEEEEEED